MPFSLDVFKCIKLKMPIEAWQIKEIFATRLV